MTDFIKLYKKHIIPFHLINDAKPLLENNVVMSYCYEFENNFLSKYNIKPINYIDINAALNISKLNRACSILDVVLDESDITHTLYLLMVAALKRNYRFHYINLKQKENIKHFILQLK